MSSTNKQDFKSTFEFVKNNVWLSRLTFARNQFANYFLFKVPPNLNSKIFVLIIVMDFPRTFTFR